MLDVPHASQDSVLRTARRVAAEGLGEPGLGIHAVDQLIEVRRVVLREVLSEVDRQVPGRIARSRELWDCPMWVRRYLSRARLAADVCWTGGFRQEAHVAGLPTALRERVDAAIIEMRADLPHDELAVTMEVSRETVAVVRLDHAEPKRSALGLALAAFGAGDGRADAALIGMTSHRVLTTFSIEGTPERLAGQAWVAVAGLVAMVAGFAIFYPLRFGRGWPLAAFGIALLLVLLCVLSVRRAFVVARDPRFRSLNSPQDGRRTPPAHL